MTSYAGSSTAAVDSWQRKKPKTTLVGTAIGLAQTWAVPIVVAGVLVRRFLASRKKDAKKPEAAAAAAKPEPTAAARKPRRDYKVKRDQEGPLLVGVDDEEVEIQPGDNVMEGYNEAEVEAAGAAAEGAGGGNAAMLKMLQQMGYKVVMPKDGSGQVFLVPPGAKGPGGQAIEEGDEEGYDEDEEGYEEGEEEEEEEEEDE